MDLSVTRRTLDFRQELRALLASPDTRTLLAEVRARADGMDGDVRPLYRHLGRAGVLAPSWPPEYGGRGGDFTETVVLLEELVAHGVPQSLYYISVQIVGSLILQAGTPGQRAALLPRLAAGDLSVCILFTEPEHGSDLAGITTRGRPLPDGGWAVTGRKTYNLKTAYADLALCAVRTAPERSRYEGISLFLVPLDAPGVRVRPLPSLADEQFHDVRLDEARVAADAVLGAPGDGWSLITRMFAAERSGLDYYARARHWLGLTAGRLPAPPAPEARMPAALAPDAQQPAGPAPDAQLPTAPAPDADAWAGLARHQARLAATRLLTCRALQQLQEDRPDIATASLSKWHASETAQAVSWWSLEVLGLSAVRPDGADAPDRVLEAALREAPGMTVSGGASEVLLDIVTGARLLDDVGTGG
ncbi:acyl-CoA dehydrogenase family protein [Streptomyces sp. NPDC051132]|uniref:acyl-CoA dehydrogenase family protein n=1 Tax=unclassified Streptomyces TaxID=2593676 RepID=UPI00341659BC